MSEIMTERYAKIAAEFDGMVSLDLGRAFVDAKAEKERIDAEKAIIEARVEYLAVKLAETMQSEGVSKFSIKFGDEEKRIRYQEEINVSATQESGAAARVIEILEDTGNGGLVKPTVAPATLKKFVGDLRKKGENGMPDPVLMRLISAGMVVTSRDKARFY